MALITRPTRNDPAIRAEVIAKLAEDCAAWDEATSDPAAAVAGWERALERCQLSGNGYELARELEDDHLVSPDTELVEILDSASSYIWTAHDRLVQTWVAENNIRPELEIGQRAECRHGVGTISRIDETSGRYIFVPDSDVGLGKFAGGGGLLIAYEDMQAAQVSA